MHGAGIEACIIVQMPRYIDRLSAGYLWVYPQSLSEPRMGLLRYTHHSIKLEANKAPWTLIPEGYLLED